MTCSAKAFRPTFCAIQNDLAMWPTARPDCFCPAQQRCTVSFPSSSSVTRPAISLQIGWSEKVFVEELYQTS